MNTANAMTPDELAAVGRALYGDRWQTPVAQDLRVADRTVRRWLAGETPIPDGVESELRKVLVRRLKEIGGLIGYSVNPSDHSVFHYPSGAYFRYNTAGELTLLNAKMVARHNIPLITRGAEEALRQEREREPRIRGRFAGNI